MTSSAFQFDDRVRAAADRLAVEGPEAIAGLYDLAASRLYRYATSITRQSEDAEDAIQATMVKVAADPHPIIGADKPWAYLLRMTRNESLMILRRRRPWLHLMGDTLADRLGGSLSWHVDPIVTRQRNAAVWNALDGLPANQREVVVLKIWEMMTFASIGEILEISPDTAASRYRYAIKKLSKSLIDHQFDEVDSHV